MKFIPWDANYFDKGTENRDCVIRALCASTLIGYKSLCTMFNKKDDFKMGSGYGVQRGISQDEMDEFAERTKIVEKIWGDSTYSDYLGYIGTTDDDTLESFLENNINEIIKYNNIKLKRFVFFVRTPNTKKEDKHHYHATSIIMHNGEWTCLDVDTIKQIQYSIPIYVYAVKKMPKKDSPIFYDNERKTVLKQYKNMIDELNGLLG